MRGSWMLKKVKRSLIQVIWNCYNNIINNVSIKTKCMTKI